MQVGEKIIQRFEENVVIGEIRHILFYSQKIHNSLK